MTFWGIELKKGTSVIYDPRFHKVKGKLRVTKACFGVGTITSRCLVECRLRGQIPIVLCCLDMPGAGRSNMCSLDIEFGLDDGEVQFQINNDCGNFGESNSVFLSGYIVEK
ncbi:hypothetical protein MKW98_029717 [Papaver atlanticum]|uniref:Nucleoplasmin-like domain-containing protein n=1 Tax=Papaver atlanticum TaxID=357466 RepID=A0AAD4T6N6_9MAGN|nr:hypothetical protein MKW98_029717 [Papaver atlanticum]